MRIFFSNETVLNFLLKGDFHTLTLMHARYDLDMIGLLNHSVHIVLGYSGFFFHLIKWHLYARIWKDSGLPYHNEND